LSYQRAIDTRLDQINFMKAELALIEDKLANFDQEPHLSRRKWLEETTKVIIPNMIAGTSRILPDANLLLQLIDQRMKFEGELAREQIAWLKDRADGIKRRIAIVEDEIAKLRGG